MYSEQQYFVKSGKNYQMLVLKKLQIIIFYTRISLQKYAKI